jgi:hypothetical protein
VEWQNERMSQAGESFYLALESFIAEDRALLSAQNLDCDRALVPCVVGEIHCRHSTCAQLALDGVAISECVADC